MSHVVKEQDQYFIDGVEYFSFKNKDYMIRDLPRDFNKLMHCELRLLARALGFNPRIKKEGLKMLIELSISFE